MSQLWHNIRVVDLIDIVVVAIFVYGCLAWARRARSRFVLIGLAVLVAIYFAANLLEMQLTLLIFQAAIAVAVIALVVIFQEEIRRVFERIATSGSRWRRRHRSSNGHTNELIETLVGSAAALARKRTGALVVLKGKEPLERHLTGGVDLDGEVSSQLFDSIFDTSSAGHDGAAVIVEGRIQSFGVHLPLSAAIDAKTGFGTRHTAALGISERSDALVVVVSEERGEISVAEGGKLELVESTSELGERLDRFFGELSPDKRSRPWSRLVANNMGTKALSLAIAIVSWLILFGTGSGLVARTYSVPIEVQDVPAGFMLDEPRPAQVQVTLTASKRAFAGLDPTELLLAVSAEGLSHGSHPLPVLDGDLQRPAGFTVHKIAPREVQLRAHESATRELTVRPKTRGRLRDGLELLSITAEPAKISLVMRKAQQNTITSVSTTAINLAGIEETTTVSRNIVHPRRARLADDSPSSVQITLEVAVTTSATEAGAE